MLTLAIDCATGTIGLSLLEEEDVCAEVYLNLGRHHTEILLPAMEQLFLLARHTQEEVDLLACTVGPGSFTGLRIGVSTVKGLALAMARPVVGVSTLEALAATAAPCRGPICPMVDAGNNQVYTCLYNRGSDGFPEAMIMEKCIDVTEFLHGLEKKEIVFLGGGAIRYGELITQILKDRAVLYGGIQQRIMASAVGLVGLHRYRRGDVLDTQAFAPSYLRLSQAEMNKED